MSSRFLIVAPIAVVITLALFFLMRGLIAPSDEEPEIAKAPEFEIGRKVKETEPDPEPLKRPPEEKPPPAQKPDYKNLRNKMSTDGVAHDGPPITDFKGEFGPLVADGGAVPIIRPRPPYPGCGQGTGEVVLEYSVEPDGRVSDVEVVSSTSSCFATAAKRATRQWRYRPRVEEGQPVRSGRLRVKLVFQPE